MQLLVAFVLAFSASMLTTGDAARILGFFSSPGRSHLLIHCAVADTLARAGHNVTVIATKPNVYPDAKYNYIHLDTLMLSVNYMNKLVNNPPPFYKLYPGLVLESTQMANRTMWHPEMQQFLREHGEGSFDLVLLGYFINDFHVGLGSHFKCPVIISFMVQTVFSLNEMIGNPSEHAYVPTLFSGLSQPMDFRARLRNYLIYLFEYYYMGPLLEREVQKYYSYNFPTAHGFPSLDEARRNVGLVFINHWFAQGPIRPQVPNLIEIGGIQIKEQPDPLPPDIARLLDESPEGVIYFSLGSNIRSAHLLPGKAQIMFNVMSKLPYKVLWNWADNEYPGNASNIVYKSWLPQVDILAHPNFKLFITHGGKGSVVEAQHFGVPMVGIPLYGDQPMNMEDVQKQGYGLYVDYANLKEETLREAIEEVLHNPKYTKAVRDFSKLYRDRPMTPRQSVVWWVDYVLRHKGAKHMQSPAVHLNRWQLMSLDVLGVLLASMAVIVGLLVVIVRFFVEKGMKRVGEKKSSAMNGVGRRRRTNRRE